MNYLYPVAGARYHFNHCTFCVWAPLRQKVEVLIDESSAQRHTMTKDERGYWSVTVPSIVPGAAYWYRLDDSPLLPDPASRSQPNGVHGHSLVTDPMFSWTDADWKGIPLKDMVIYEVHVGTFSHTHDFDGVIAKLPHLRDLGINAIELMPVAQFPGSRNWGYDGVFPFAVQNSYGGIIGLKRLVNEAHAHGIAVILDVVYNHLGPEGNYLEEYGPYFTTKYKTFWGKAINFDDAYCDGVRNYFWQNALMWLDEFHMDGLRLDAVHAIWDFSANHFVAELTQKVKALQADTGREKVLIAEFDLNNPKYIAPPELGGYGLDGQWTDEFHHALHSLLTGEVSGYYEDFGDAAHLAKALQHSYVYTGQYSTHRKKHFGTPATGRTYGQFVVFSQNHDQVGNRMLGDRLSNHLTFEALKLAAAAVLLAPQVPMLFMGEEYGEKNPFMYFISHTDDELVGLVRKGRKEEFAYFNWPGEVPDPQSEETFTRCVLSWDFQQHKLNKTLFRLYQFLINFRKTRIACSGQDAESVKVHDPGIGNVIAFERSSGPDKVLIILNFDKSTAPFRLTSPRSLPSRKIFDSSALEWGGPGEITFSNFNANHEILLHAESAVIFEY
jgi:maltooligosyltrehalose trehalohydrolase